MSTFPILHNKQDKKVEATLTTEEVPTTEVPEPIAIYRERLHEAKLKELIEDYHIKILGKGRKSELKALQERHARKHDPMSRKECNCLCNRIPYSYPDSLVWRHLRNRESIVLVGKMMELGYRYCMDCKRIMPQSEIEKLDRILKSSQRKQTIEKTKANDNKHTPIICPCCKGRTAYLSVLVRKTKMKDELFRFEGY